ncbi:hypothetical protein CLV31_11347 [Algoriphagus aquaeductus]|uniref:Uncharacterized protein n=1 Tax=Algoriphagus aquaeductus TaxID=475299 RepID=A0A326RNC6_9BACT|nr:hypothetical protein CLV31_11347 [Algoriphagus aquaeductus]
MGQKPVFETQTKKQIPFLIYPKMTRIKSLSSYFQKNGAGFELA